MAPPGWLFGRNTPYTPTLYPPTSATRIGESLIRSFGSLSMNASMFADVTSTAGGAAVWATAATAVNGRAASANRQRPIMTFLRGDFDCVPRWRHQRAGWWLHYPDSGQPLD